MGIHDRDYYHDPAPRGGFAAMHMWSVTTWLIVSNVAVFLIDQITPRWGLLVPGSFYPMPMGTLEAWGFFSQSLAITHLQIWRFITFQFLHASPWHLFGNMLALYFFGPIVESYFGSRRFLVFYLLCGIAGSVCYILLYMLGFLVTSPYLVASPYVPLVGASAGIFGILMAAARVAPDVTVMLLFPPIPMRLKTLAWIMMGIAVYAVLFQGRNAGGEAAHIGGGLLGLLIMSNQHWLNPFSLLHRRRRMRLTKDWSRDLNR